MATSLTPIRSRPGNGPRAFALAALIASLGTSPPTLAQDGSAQDGAPQAQAGTAADDAATADGGTGFAVGDGFAALPDAAPLPAGRPLDPEDRGENDAADIAAADIPLPRTPPANSGVNDGADDGADDRDGADERDGMPEDAEDADPPVFRTLAETDAELAACTAKLTELGATFSPAEPVVEARDRDCGIARPLRVEAIRPDIAMQPDALMRCETAVALAQWTKDYVEPAADLLGRGAVTTIDHGSTYICRRRNNAATGKLSEHSFGNAVDVMGFRFAQGDALRIEPREGGPAGAFQAAVRKGSCEHFTTVLGPGTNAAHADHLHLDVKARNGGYRLCE